MPPDQTVQLLAFNRTHHDGLSRSRHGSLRSIAIGYHSIPGTLTAPAESPRAPPEAVTRWVAHFRRPDLDVWPGRNTTCSDRRFLLLPDRPSGLNRSSLRSTMPLNQFQASFIRLPLPRPTAAVQRRALFRGITPIVFSFLGRQVTHVVQGQPPDRAYREMRRPPVPRTPTSSEWFQSGVGPTRRAFADCRRACPGTSEPHHGGSCPTVRYPTDR